MNIGKLKQFLHQPAGLTGQLGTRFHGDSVPQPTLGTINVILAVLESEANLSSRVLNVASSTQ